MPIVKKIDLRSINLRNTTAPSEAAKVWLGVKEGRGSIDDFFQILLKTIIFLPGKSKGGNILQPDFQPYSHSTPFYTSLGEMVSGFSKTRKIPQHQIHYAALPFTEFLDYLHQKGRATHMNPGCGSERFFPFEEVEELARKYRTPLVQGPAPKPKPTKKPPDFGISVPDKPLEKAIDLGAWKTVEEIAKVLKVKTASVRRHLAAVVNSGYLGGFPAAISARYSLEVLYHVARSLKGMPLNSEKDFFHIGFPPKKPVVPLQPPPTILVDHPQKIELEREVKRLQKELDKKDLALSKVNARKATVKSKLDEKLDKMKNFYVAESDGLKQEVENLRLKLKNFAADFKIPTSLNDILTLAEFLYPGMIEALPEARRSAESYAYATEQKIIVEAWDMMAALGGHLYNTQSSKGDFSVKKFQDATGFELALRESQKTKKEKNLDAARVFNYNGRKIKAYPHIKSKIRTDFRLHFAVVDHTILICHLGQHLPTSQYKN